MKFFSDKPIKPNDILKVLREELIVHISKESYYNAEASILKFMDYKLNVTNEEITPLGMTILAMGVAKTPEGAFLYY
jgi:hypothetical protein